LRTGNTAENMDEKEVPTGIPETNCPVRNILQRPYEHIIENTMSAE